MLERLNKEERLEGMVVIFMPLDSISLYAENEEGGRTLPA
jgi:hypothetical protein